MNDLVINTHILCDVPAVEQPRDFGRRVSVTDSTLDHIRIVDNYLEVRSISLLIL